MGNTHASRISWKKPLTANVAIMATTWRLLEACPSTLPALTHRPAHTHLYQGDSFVGSSDCGAQPAVQSLPLCFACPFDKGSRTPQYEDDSLVGVIEPNLPGSGLLRMQP